MQEDAHPHKTIEVFHFLEYFDRRVIVLDYSTHTRNNMNSPSHTPDLTLCDFLCGENLKNEVYQQNRQATAEVKQYFSTVCKTILFITLALVYANFVLRLQHVAAANGAYIENIIYLVLHTSSQYVHTAF